MAFAISVDRGWFSSVPDLAIGLLWIIPALLWIYWIYIHEEVRGRRHLFIAHPVMSLLTFLIIGGAVGASVGGLGWWTLRMQHEHGKKTGADHVSTQTNTDTKIKTDDFPESPELQKPRSTKDVTPLAAKRLDDNHTPDADLIPKIAKDVGEIKNSVVPVPRHLTEEQQKTLAIQLRAGGVFETAVRHTQGNMESQNYADDFVTALKAAGWTVNPHPKFLIQEHDSVGVWIMVADMSKPPTCALLLQQGLKAIGIEAIGVAVPEISATPSTACELFIGLKPS